MGFGEIAHSSLIALAVFAGCGLIMAFVGMDRAARTRATDGPIRVFEARHRLQRWAWIAVYMSVVMSASLIALLIGA